MDAKLFDRTDSWLKGGAGDTGHIAVSSRARLARNLGGFPFAPHAKPPALENVEKYIAEGIGRCERLGAFERLELAKLSGDERAYLRESRLISREMEQGGEHRVAWVSPEESTSILVNEEDHLRLQVVRTGLGIRDALEALKEIDAALADVVGYAWSERYGYLTACPTNVGTGFRASVMLHLPGLRQLKEIESGLQGIGHHGLTVRGFYGENSEFTGDFYQISNEITLGRTVDEIMDTLMLVVNRLVEKESEARLELFRHHESSVADAIWRSYGTLSFARRIGSSEAMRLLSMIRLGIDKGWFGDLSHAALNRLVLEVQPAHLERRRGREGKFDSRDEARAAFLRERVQAANGHHKDAAS